MLKIILLVAALLLATSCASLPREQEPKEWRARIYLMDASSGVTAY